MFPIVEIFTHRPSAFVETVKKKAFNQKKKKRTTKTAGICEEEEAGLK